MTGTDELLALPLFKIPEGFIEKLVAATEGNTTLHEHARRINNTAMLIRVEQCIDAAIKLCDKITGGLTGNVGTSAETGSPTLNLRVMELYQEKKRQLLELKVTLVGYKAKLGVDYDFPKMHATQPLPR